MTSEETNLTAENELEPAQKADQDRDAAQDAEALAKAQREAELAALAQAFDDVRAQSSNSKIVSPPRWEEAGIVPEHMGSADFADLIRDWVENGPAEKYLEDLSTSEEAKADKADASAEDCPFEGLKIPEGYRLTELEGEWVLVPSDETRPKATPLPDCTGIALLTGAATYYLYDENIMTEAYAKWSVMAAEDSDLATFVTNVREESRIYPRPMPATSMQNEPFSMSAEQVEKTFELAQQQQDYADIQKTEASNGDVYYFSTDYLSPAYANSLAQWASVGRFMNV